MQHLRLIVVLCVLLQLSTAQKDDELDRGEDDGVLSTWDEAEKDENVVKDLEEDAEPDLPNEEAERALYDTDLSPNERLVLEADSSWQEDADRENFAFHLEDTSPEVEGDDGNTWRHPAYPTEKQFEMEVEAKDDVYDAYLERGRQLEEQPNQAVDEDEEEEDLPVIPGLTDVDLIAFNPEFANAEVLDKIIDWSYDQVAALSRYRDTYIHAEDLYNFLLKTLNPLDEEMDTEDEQILTDAVVELRKQQGLLNDEQIVYRGFIARGMPLRFLQSLAHEMHQTVQKRRLQASSYREEL